MANNTISLAGTADEPAGVVGSGHADHALTLTSTARMIKAGVLRSWRVYLDADPTTTTPSDSRCPPLDFAIGLYERSSLTRLDRRVSLVPIRPYARASLHTPQGPTAPDPEPGLADMAFAVT